MTVCRYVEQQGATFAAILMVPFALTVAAELAGAETAQRIQLSIEYDPSPPFTAGSPDRAPASVRAGMAERFGTRLATFRGELEEVVARQT
jgi:cyclohexyl-isocyanide hydratase